MSDDQSTRDESAVSFPDRVTIDTLTDRPPTHTFDMDLFQQDPDLTVRLEGKFTDVRGDSRPVPDNAVLMFNSKGYDLPSTVIYNRDTGQKEPNPDGSDFSGVFQAVRDGSLENMRYISEGDRVDVSFISFAGPGFTDEKKTTATLEITAIRCGHLS